MPKLSDEILSDLAKDRGAKGGGSKGPPMGDEPAGDDAGDGETYASDEETAMQEFEDASTPAEKVKALKSFMSICYPQLTNQSDE